MTPAPEHDQAFVTPHPPDTHAPLSFFKLAVAYIYLRAIEFLVRNNVNACEGKCPFILSTTLGDAYYTLSLSFGITLLTYIGVLL